ncbi:hypothetical protein BKN38_01260 [Helicobacter sp. CLO-3]|uniref:hypothetical protein n=1 Tax=unclassified Helicobacter TaxID=2593540 RepID=UPI0008057686|nr:MULTISPECIES: hypothetical protein [unclassified Helicobacter]OBV29742.1 hypothetical protein BA723_00065 [Helicobacter sp. CLO-3]OHU85195.1 hypothetical protein BKN38_01260 [Helicobacter sp. CLO-3]
MKRGVQKAESRGKKAKNVESKGVGLVKIDSGGFGAVDSGFCADSRAADSAGVDFGANFVDSAGVDSGVDSRADSGNVKSKKLESKESQKPKTKKLDSGFRKAIFAKIKLLQSLQAKIPESKIPESKILESNFAKIKSALATPNPHSNPKLPNSNP